MGLLCDIPEEHEEVLAAYAAMPVATRRLIQRLNYEQTQRNKVSYLGLQFFIDRLHQGISMEVIKSGTTDMYQALLTAHTYETALRDKQGKNGSTNGVKISEMDADFEDDSKRAKIKAIKCKYQQRRMFTSNGQPTSDYPPEVTAPTTATTTTMAAFNNPDLDQELHANQIPLLVRLVITVRKRITSKLIATRGNKVMPLWSKFKKWRNKKGERTLKQSSTQKTKSQLL